jgi:hypothetical protein
MEKSPGPTASGPTSLPDPRKLLAHWMEWERGETPPGRVMSNLKTDGMRDALELLVAQADGQTATTAAE